METRLDFALATLKKLDVSASEENITFLLAWMARENTKAAYNPGATTLNTSGAVSNFNKVGVKNYESLEAGSEAWAKTLKGKRYTPVLEALKSGKGTKSLDENLRMWTDYVAGPQVKDLTEGQNYVSSFKTLVEKVKKEKLKYSTTPLYTQGKSVSKPTGINLSNKLTQVARTQVSNKGNFFLRINEVKPLHDIYLYSQNNPVIFEQKTKAALNFLGLV